MQAESEEVKKELQRISFPSMAGDVAPHALVPKACTCLSKQVTKIDALLAQFVGAKALSTLQTKNLVWN